MTKHVVISLIKNSMLKINKLYSTKTIIITQLIAATVSAIFIGIATGITTLKIPKIEDKISKEDEIIKDFRYQITKDLINGLYAMDIYNDRRINLIDFRLERMMNNSKTEFEETLLKEVIDKTLEQINRWNSMFILERDQSIIVNLPPSDPNAPSDLRILTLEASLIQARRAAYSRLDEIIQQVNEHEFLKSRYKTTMEHIEKLFRFFQMIGLFTLVIAVGIEAYRKLKEVATE